jgi:hypothetical protein
MVSTYRQSRSAVTAGSEADHSNYGLPQFSAHRLTSSSVATGVTFDAVRTYDDQELIGDYSSQFAVTVPHRLLIATSSRFYSSLFVLLFQLYEKA